MPSKGGRDIDCASSSSRLPIHRPFSVPLPPNGRLFSISVCIPPKLKEILGAIKVDDLMALIALLKNGSIKTLKDLVQAIKEKFPELYALLKAIYVKVKIVIDELKLKIGDKAMAFLKEIGTLLVDDAKEVYKFVGDSFKSNPQMAPNMLNAFLGLFGGISVTMNGKEYSACKW